jgi:hypothetical protein
MHTQEDIQRAKKRVKAKKGFYQHLMSFVIVNMFLFALNMITYPFHWWFVYPLLGWGVGLAFHYVEVFGIPGFDILSKEWEDRELDRELMKMNQDKPQKILTTPKRMSKTDDQLELKELRKNYDESEFV